ncbi:hypothetical protein DCO46_14515 [Flavobacterium sp. HTF]|nr:hypothetical protein DCO46_14515 [Flavobacterium sp. HTF]
MPASSRCRHFFLFQVSSFKFQVSGFRFQVSGFRFQVSGFRFQVSGFRFQVSGYFTLRITKPQRAQSFMQKTLRTLRKS